MKWLQQKWYDVSIRTKSILLMGMMLAVTWVLVALVMIQLHTFSERSSVIMDEYMILLASWTRFLPKMHLWKRI